MQAQETPHCENPDFQKVVERYLNTSIPVLDPDQLSARLHDYTILDAREREEFEVSHIAGAHYVGYDDFDESALAGIPKDQKVLVYCSIGYRSEKIGERLRDLGYTQVYNLYGGIFEWINRQNTVLGLTGVTTDTVHGYSRSWSKWVENQKIVKVW